MAIRYCARHEISRLREPGHAPYRCTKCFRSRNKLSDKMSDGMSDKTIDVVSAEKESKKPG